MAEQEPQSGKKSIQWRKNVLLLLGIAYGSMLAIFGAIAIWSPLTTKEAFDVISVPFTALIGGTLAVVKDLLD